MNSEAKIMIAFLFNRSGKIELTESELYLPLSMELGWLSTKESQEFIKYAIKENLIIQKDGLLRPNFQLEKINIPLGFIPSKKFFDEKKEKDKGNEVIDDIITKISTITNYSKQKILEEIKQEEKEKDILFTVATLYIARKYNIDVTYWYESVEKCFLKKN